MSVTAIGKSAGPGAGVGIDAHTKSLLVACKNCWVPVPVQTPVSIPESLCEDVTIDAFFGTSFGGVF